MAISQERAQKIAKDYLETWNYAEVARRNTKKGLKSKWRQVESASGRKMVANASVQAIVHQITAKDFNVDEAKRAVARVLRKDRARDRDKLTAADLVFKAHNVYGQGMEGVNPVRVLVINQGSNASSTSHEIPDTIPKLKGQEEESTSK